MLDAHSSVGQPFSMADSASSSETSASKERSLANLRPWAKGRSGNPKGRAPAPIDIAELARQHGPRCIEVLAAMLDDSDRKLRGFATLVLLDRGYGRPKQPIA